jgi:hypothetical protein
LDRYELAGYAEILPRLKNDQFALIAAQKILWPCDA